MSTLEKPTPETYESDAPAQQAGIFLEQPADDLPQLISVGEAIPPLTELHNPIEAVRRLGRLVALYGDELKVRATPGGKTTMHMTEAAHERFIQREAQRVRDQLEKIYADSPAAA